MPDIITTGEHEVSTAERAAERDLGAVINEVEHLTAQLAEHTTTIEGLREDRQWITQRFEAMQRDLEAIPRVPGELTEAIANLVARIERIETSATHEEETHPPERHESQSEEEDDHQGEPERRNFLDKLF